MTDATKVTLGDHEVNVYAQRHAYLTKKLADFFTELQAADTDVADAGGVITLLGARTYDLLTAVLPQYGKNCPRYEFAGYGSQAAYDQVRAREQALTQRARLQAELAAHIPHPVLDDDEDEEQPMPLPPEEEARIRAELEAIEVPDDPYDEREDKSPSFPEMVVAFETAAKVNRFDVLKVVGKIIEPKLVKAWINSKVAEAISGGSARSLASTGGVETSMSSGAKSPTSTGNGDSPSNGSQSSSKLEIVGE